MRTNVTRQFRSRERTFHCVVVSFLGTKVHGNETSRYRGSGAHNGRDISCQFLVTTPTVLFLCRFVLVFFLLLQIKRLLNYGFVFEA